MFHNLIHELGLYKLIVVLCDSEKNYCYSVCTDETVATVVYVVCCGQ